MEWHQPQSPLKINFKGSLSAHCLLGLWRSNSCGFGAEWEDNQLRQLHQTSERTRKAFKTSSTSHESNTNLATGVTMHTSMNTREAIKTFGWTVLLPSTLWPRPSTLRFPTFWNSEGCDLRYEVSVRMTANSRSKNLTTWTERGVMLTRHAHTCSGAAGGDFVEKYGTESNHHYSYCAIFMIYGEENKGHYFPIIPRGWSWALSASALANSSWYSLDGHRSWAVRFGELTNLYPCLGSPARSLFSTTTELSCTMFIEHCA